MKIATKNAVAAALAVALAGMGLPAAALAAGAAEDTAATEIAKAGTSAEVSVTVDNLWDWIDESNVTDINGKWFNLSSAWAEDYQADTTVKYMISISNGKMNCYVDGAGDAGKFFPLPECCSKYADKAVLHVGAGITSIGVELGSSPYSPIKKVEFAEGSQLKNIGACAFWGAKSVNLEECKQLETIGMASFTNATAKITVPSSVTTIGPEAFAGATNVTVTNPEGASTHPSAFIDTKVAIISTPKVKVAGSNKVTVSWSTPYTNMQSQTTGKYVKKAVSYAVKYKVQYRVKGDKAWKKTGYTSAKSKTLSMLTKGKKYQVRVTAYKKSGSKWKALTTSTYKTSSAVKGYNPAPSLKAGKKTITASWTKVPGATSYKVYYRTGSDAWKVKTAKKATVKLSGLAGAAKYQVKVRAYKGKAGICESPVKTATTAA